jgi:YD repeat-containing protein
LRTVFGWDGLGDLLTSTDPLGLTTTNYTYANASNVGKVTYPNGVKAQFAYDMLNRVSSLNSQASSYTYQRGPTGNLISSTESSGRTENWTYDGIYRLTGESIGLAPSGHNGSIGYSLDPVGNRLLDASSLERVSKIGSASRQVLLLAAVSLLSFCHEETAEAVDG